MILIAIDPGIDVAAAAVYDAALCDLSRVRSRYGYAEAARGYRGLETARTKAGEPMPARCLALCRWMADVCGRWNPTRVVIEVPRRAGTYDTHIGRQRGRQSLNAAALAKLERAIAAITIGASFGGAEVIEYPAAYGRSLASKESRHAALNRSLLAVGQPEIRGNADQRDAAFLGLHYLATELGR